MEEIAPKINSSNITQVKEKSARASHHKMNFFRLTYVQRLKVIEPSFDAFE